MIKLVERMIDRILDVASRRDLELRNRAVDRGPGVGARGGADHVRRRPRGGEGAHERADVDVDLPERVFRKPAHGRPELVAARKRGVAAGGSLSGVVPKSRGEPVAPPPGGEIRSC